MSEEKPKEPRVSKVQWVTVIIAVLGLVVAFLGVNFQNISSWYSETMFPEADFIVESWTTPTRLPNKTTDFLLSLSVSPEYFVVTSVNLKSEKPYQGEPMQFSISFDNKGKKSVEQPRVVLYCIDYVYRVWGAWNKSDANEILINGCSLEYHFPSLDQKTIGAWIFLVLLYDDAEGVLTSYELKHFTVTGVAPRPWWEPLLLVGGIIGGSSILGYGGGRLSAYLEKRRKKSKGTTKTRKKKSKRN